MRRWRRGTRVYKVLGFPSLPVSAPKVSAFAEDLAPTDARQKALEPGFRPRSARVAHQSGNAGRSSGGATSGEARL